MFDPKTIVTHETILMDPNSIFQLRFLGYQGQIMESIWNQDIWFIQTAYGA